MLLPNEGRKDVGLRPERPAERCVVWGFDLSAQPNGVGLLS